MKVYIGHDSREQKAFDVASATAHGFGCDVIPLYEDRLRMSGMLTRPTDRRGQMWDLNSNAPQSTEFAISRFAVPILAHAGWCLFADADVVFMQNPMELEDYQDSSKAVCVVKHKHFEDIKEVVTKAGLPLYPAGWSAAKKMDGQTQTLYPRKLWSSVMLWNCDHPANRRLNLQMLNQWPGRDLHAFKWLADSEIGELPGEANWLVGMQPKPERPIIAHYTLGTPDMVGHEHDPHANLWLEASQR